MIFRKIKRPQVRANAVRFVRPQTFILTTDARGIRVFKARSFDEARTFARRLCGPVLDKLFWTSAKNAAAAVRSKGAADFCGVQIGTENENKP